MSTRALAAYENARKHQLLRNDARRIRTKIDDARKDPADSGRRWPFELLQNAYDAGKRADRDGISVLLKWEAAETGARVVFQHDGAIFAMQDIAALLSGGSSKDYDSEQTTGRFGTGFLVSHVLSAVVVAQGLLGVEDGEIEQFELPIDRRGNEEQILANTEQCDAALQGATPVHDAGLLPSARFSWLTDNVEPYVAGVDALELALPHVFGTCPNLVRVEIHWPSGARAIWTASSVSRREDGDLSWVERLIHRSGDSGERDLAVVRVSGHRGVAAQYVIESIDGGHAVVTLPEGFPVLFRRFPIRGTGQIPIAMVLDGPFALDQERRSVHLADSAPLLEDALEALVNAVRVAYVRADRHRYGLAWLDAFTTNEPNTAAWWRTALRRAATRLAELPLVETTMGPLSAVPLGTAEFYAGFPVPRLNGYGPPEVAFQKMWSLVARAAHAAPPVEHLASGWTPIAHGWAALDVAVNRLDLQALAQNVRAEGSQWDALAVTEPRSWLPDFLDAVGCAWKVRGGSDPTLLQGLLPDQTGTLRSPDQLARDQGIPDELKEIAEQLGIIVRGRLLHLDIEEAAVAPDRPHLTFLLDVVSQQRRTSEQMLEHCLAVLEKAVPNTKRAYATIGSVAEFGARLLKFLWRSNLPDARTFALRVPLLSRSDQYERPSPTRKYLAPVSTWPERARQYSGAWPSARILAEAYSDPVVLKALVGWDLAHAGPIVEERAAELKDTRLVAMLAPDSSVPEGCVVADETFTTIALLRNEALNRCSEDPERARELLGFLVDFVARETEEWSKFRNVTGRAGGADVRLRLRDALWLGDLRSRSWVPTDSPEGRAKVAATPESLRPLLEPCWIDGNPNAIVLLTDGFGFDALDLQLLGTAEDRRQAVRDQLAALVAIADGNPGVLERAANDLRAKQDKERRVKRLRNYGLAVQDAIRKALEDHELNVVLEDHGFDFKVAVDQDTIEEITISTMVLADWLVEVKATVRDEVALTPTQAHVAAATGDRYVICVVPLDALPEVDADPNELVAEVANRARCVLGMGPHAAQTTGLVTQARTSTVGLKNEQNLRYTVRRAQWEAGLPLDAWVQRIRELAKVNV